MRQRTRCVTTRSEMYRGPNGSYIPAVNGNELLRKLRRLARARGVEVRVDQRQGKGSHATLFYGRRKTTLKDPKQEIGAGLLRSMLNQLGLTPRDIDQ